MRIDLRASSYPSLLSAVGLAIINCDGMEQAIPPVFRAALNVSLQFQRSVFEATRGLEVHLKLTKAAVAEGAPAFIPRWEALAKQIRSSASKRGEVAHAGMSIFGGGIVVELDDDGVPTGVARRKGPTVASLSKYTKGGRTQISEEDIRELADRVANISNELNQLAADITVTRLPNDV